MTQKKRDKHDLIIVTEKYDGSNVGIAKKDGKIYALTRSGYEAKTSKYEHHLKFAEYVERNKKLYDKILNEGERLAGEWLSQPHGIKYDIVGEPIVFFDYFNDKNERYPFIALMFLNLYYGIRVVRMLHCGNAKTVNELLPILNDCTDWIKPINDKPEGMVYRVERKGKCEFLAKWVRQDFIAGKYLK